MNQRAVITTFGQEIPESPENTESRESFPSNFSLFDIIEAENPLEILRQAEMNREELREAITQTTYEEIDVRLEELEESTEEIPREYETYIEEIVDNMDNEEEFFERLEDIRLQVRSQVAIERIQMNADTQISTLRHLILNNALVQTIIAKLPQQEQERIERAVSSESEELVGIVDEAVQQQGTDIETILMIGTYEDAQEESNLTRLIERLPFGEAISQITQSTRMFEMLGFYNDAAEELELHDKTVFMDMNGMTIGELFSITDNINTAELDPTDPADLRAIDYITISERISVILPELHESFITQVNANEELSEEERTAILSEVQAENLTVASAIAHLWGNVEFQRNWYNYLGGLYAYTRRIYRFAYNDEYFMKREHLRANMRRLWNRGNIERARRRAELLRPFGGEILQEHENLQNALRTNEERMSNLFSGEEVLNEAGEIDTNRLQAEFYELVDEHNNIVTRWNETVNETVGGWLEREQRLSRINESILEIGETTNNWQSIAERIPDDDWDFLRSNFPETVSQLGLEELNRETKTTLIELWVRDYPGPVELFAGELTTEMERLNQVTSEIQTDLNNKTQRINNFREVIVNPQRLRQLRENLRLETDQLDELTSSERRLEVLERQINDVQQDSRWVREHLRSPVRQRLDRARAAIPTAIFAGLTVLPEIYDVTQGRSNIETALIHTAQNGVYLLPVAGSIASIKEIIDGRTLAGEEIRGAGQWASMIGFTALGLVSDVLYLLPEPITTGAGAGIRTAIGTARVVRSADRLTEGARTVRGLARVSEEAATLTSTARRAERGVEITEAMGRNVRRLEELDIARAEHLRNMWNPLRQIRESATNLRQIWNLETRTAMGVLSAGTRLGLRLLSTPVALPLSVLREGGRALQLSNRIFLRGNNVLLKIQEKVFRIGDVTGDVENLRHLRNNELDEIPEIMDNLRANAQRLEANQPTIFSRFAEYVNNGRIGRGLRRLETYGGIAALGTIGISIFSGGNIAPEQVYETSTQIAETAGQTIYRAGDFAVNWLNEDHNVTAYERIIEDIQNNTLDQFAIDERIPSDEDERMEFYIRNWENAEVRRHALASGMNLNEIQQRFAGGNVTLLEATASDSGATQELT